MTRETLTFTRSDMWHIEIEGDLISIGRWESSVPFTFCRGDRALLMADVSRLLDAHDEGSAPPIAVTPS